ncbi:hypothetical protein C1646_773319 [Rhizophagus diaphanus]|nr:hypothetical protein C1646_773319 [Rhizophagus diaphanus] [Rhizophagus sp. MUCL 43196]
MFGLQAFAKGTEFASQRLYSSNSIKPSGKINPPIVIRPGDIIFGNLDGVVCIPRRLLDKVVEMCKPVNTKRLKEQVKKGMYKITCAKEDDDYLASWGS